MALLTYFPIYLLFLTLSTVKCVVPNSQSGKSKIRVSTIWILFPVDDEFKRYRPYEIVQINDPSDKSAGIYFRISQKGVDYLATLTSEGLPLIFHRMMLPSISESGFTVKDAVITRITRPDISVKFIEGLGYYWIFIVIIDFAFLGIDISIRLPELEIRGDAHLDVLFVAYKSQLIAVSNNMTVKMRVAIHRSLDENLTNVNVSLFYCVGEVWKKMLKFEVFRSYWGFVRLVFEK